MREQFIFIKENMEEHKLESKYVPTCKKELSSIDQQVKKTKEALESIKISKVRKIIQKKEVVREKGGKKVVFRMLGGKGDLLTEEDKTKLTKRIDKKWKEMLRKHPNYYTIKKDIRKKIRKKFFGVKSVLGQKYKKLRIQRKQESFVQQGGGKTKEKKDNEENILQLVRKYLVVKDKEKKLFGEVFTPVELICDMLKQLPSNVWKNKDLKWLDPANGIGNFPIVVYFKLMKGLSSSIPNEEKRSKHIIENMLYMVELNPVNCKVCKKIFKMINPNVTPNILKAGFFQVVDKKKKTNVYSRVFNETVNFNDRTNQFDIIMGNPPYNKGGTGKGGGVFWLDFVYNSINLLNNKGYLNFVHPLGWRKPFKDGDQKNNAGRVWHTFKQQGNLIYVRISDEKIPNFPKVDYYVFQKNTPDISHKTRITNKFRDLYYTDSILLSDFNFIPNLVQPLALGILKKLFKNTGTKFGIIRDQKFKPIKSQIGSPGIEHAYMFTPKKKNYELVGQQMDDIPEYYNKPKLIMTYKAGKQKANLYCKFYQQIIGGTANTMYQIVTDKTEGIKLEKFLNSKLISFLLHIIQYSEPPNYINEFKILNMISIPLGLPNNPTDKDIYKYFKLSKKEIALIEKSISSPQLGGRLGVYRKTHKRTPKTRRINLTNKK